LTDKLLVAFEDDELGSDKRWTNFRTASIKLSPVVVALVAGLLVLQNNEYYMLS